MLSIIIPTLNSGRTLEACLAAIRGQNFPRHELEIVIADADSTDDTLAIARRHGVEQIAPTPCVPARPANPPPSPPAGATCWP